MQSDARRRKLEGGDRTAGPFKWVGFSGASTEYDFTQSSSLNPLPNPLPPTLFPYSFNPLPLLTQPSSISTQSSTMDITKIKWLPSPPINPPFNVEERIKTLRSYLNPNNPLYQPKRQHVNIEAVIKLYEEGKIDGIRPISVKNGKIVSEEEIWKGPFCSWTEESFHQMTQKFAYGHGRFGPTFHEVSFTAPGNHLLAMSTTKGGLTTLL